MMNSWNLSHNFRMKFFYKDQILGVIGLGKIGKEVIKRCQSFNMKVIVYDPYVNQKIYEGVYCMYSGPNFETPAEINALKVIGGNAVGMSTVPEVLVANHCSLPVIGISVITNLAAGMNKTKLSHQETLENASLAENNVLNLIKQFIQEVQFDDTSRDN